MTEPLPPSRYSNPDLAPVPAAQRTWGLWHFASLWVGLSVCIPTYMLAASLIGAGMNWWQALFTILLGNAVVLVPLLVNAHAGTSYGIPFPVYVRASYGLQGAHLPGLLRAIVACGWFGIQTWIGGLAISEILGLIWPAWRGLGGGATFMGFGLPAYLGFAAFWLINLWFVWKGTESIKWLESLAAPFLIVIGLVLLWWAASRAGGLGQLLEGSGALRGGGTAPTASFGSLFLPWLTAMVGYWATLSLSIPDFTRYARSQRDQMVGQTLGLLTTMPLFAFIGIAVTSATVMLYGQAIWNPVELVARLAGERGPLLAIIALLAILVATLTTNLAANVVAPANAFANLSPRRISARLGGLIAAAIGVLILPWKLLDAYQTWLISYSGLLGAVGGVIVCDYLVVRGRRLSLHDLYAEDGSYGLINRSAIIATVAGILVALAGTLHPSLHFLFSGAWFSAALVSFVLYSYLMRPK
ncbi:MAG: NCS1 family nucleobase:cation symporter-1 [Gemmatimonadales bacterium]